MYTEKVRIYPNKTQKEKIDEILWNCKNLYNYLLELDISTYKLTGKGLIGYSLEEPAKKFIKNKIPSVVRQNVIRRLTISFQRFFSHQCRFPKFKSINQYRSFTYKQFKHGFNIDSSHIKLTGLGKIKAIFTRPIHGIIKQCTIKKMKSNNYYAFITVDNCYVSTMNIGQKNQLIGIDLGISRFFTDNEGHYVASPKFLRRNLKKLAKAQRELSRKQKGSHNWEKSRIKVARLHEKVSNTRRDFHFKVAYYLVINYKEVICENLQTGKMFPGKTKRERMIRRALLDIGLYNFLIILEQMATKYNCKLTKVDPYYTSQICSQCGSIVKKDLSVRIHVCPNCGLEIDRDVNAAINILHRGKNISVGTTVGMQIPALVEISIPGVEGAQQAE